MPHIYGCCAFDFYWYGLGYTIQDPCGNELCGVAAQGDQILSHRCLFLRLFKSILKLI